MATFSTPATKHAGTAQGERLTGIDELTVGVALTRLASVRPVRSPHRDAEHLELCRLDEAAARSEEGEAARFEALTGLGVHCGGGVLEGGVEGEAGAPVDRRIVGLDE